MINTEEGLAKKLKEWMKESKDPVVIELSKTVGGIQILKEQYGNITLDEAIEKTSKIILARMLQENKEELEKLK